MFVTWMGMWVKEESERARRRSWPPPSRVVPSRWMAGGEEDFGGDMAVGKEMLDDGLERVVVETDVRLMQDLTGFPSIYMYKLSQEDDEERCCKGRTWHHGIFDLFLFCTLIVEI